MALRPRPMRRRGYTRVSVRKWIKDPEQRVIIPDHVRLMSDYRYGQARKESKDHRNAVKDNPNRPGTLDSGFYEPEIFTTRRPSESSKKYLTRHPDMTEPTPSGGRSSGRRSRSSSPSLPIQSAVENQECNLNSQNK